MYYCLTYVCLMHHKRFLSNSVDLLRVYVVCIRVCTYNKTCATSEGSDQPALAPQGYPKRDKPDSLSYWVDVQADMSLCWSHGSYCRFCRALAQLSYCCHVLDGFLLALSSHL